MYSQFKKEARPTEKYTGRPVNCHGGKMEAAGYGHRESAGSDLPTADAPQSGGRSEPAPSDAVFEKCESYYYAGTDDLTEQKIMIRNKDFAMLYAGRAVFDRNGEYAGVVVGWNDMLGVILGVDHGDSWQTWGANDTGVSEDEFPSYEYRNAGTLEEPDVPHEPADPKPKTAGELIKEHEGVRGIRFSTDGNGNVQAAYIRGKHGGMKLVGTGDGLENVSSKIQKVWKR